MMKGEGFSFSDKGVGGKLNGIICLDVLKLWLMPPSTREVNDVFSA